MYFNVKPKEPPPFGLHSPTEPHVNSIKADIRDCFLPKLLLKLGVGSRATDNVHVDFLSVEPHGTTLTEDV
jgi:hypothetical protein